MVCDYIILPLVAAARSRRDSTNAAEPGRSTVVNHLLLRAP